jgi:ribonuclease P protein component
MASSAHFALHHLFGSPQRFVSALTRQSDAKLSTEAQQGGTLPVDDLSMKLVSTVSEAQWLGMVVPKRHARRAVTRTLLKRQIRNVAAAHADSLAAGLWVVRLRAPFDKSRFVSAASNDLKKAAREELDQLLRRAFVGC